VSVRFAGLAALAVLTLAACGQQQEATQEEFPVIEAPNYDANISAAGAAGISAALAMNVDAVRAAAPNYVVAEVEDHIEGQPSRSITLSAGDEEVFRVYPTADGARIHSIVTRSTQARGPTSDVVGRVKFAVAPPEQVVFCQAEAFDGAGGFACSTAEDGSFWRVYRLPESYDGPSAPFDAIDPDVLHDATLAEMRWVAPRA